MKTIWTLRHKTVEEPLFYYEVPDGEETQNIETEERKNANETL